MAGSSSRCSNRSGFPHPISVSAISIAQTRALSGIVGGQSVKSLDAAGGQRRVNCDTFTRQQRSVASVFAALYGPQTGQRPNSCPAKQTQRLN
jgi:hypothetical protein